MLCSGQVELILQDILKTDDFRKHEKLLQYMFYARKFLEDNLPFWNMEPRYHLLSGGPEGIQVFAKQGEIYAVYLPETYSHEEMVLQNVSDVYDRRWYNPRTGNFEGAATTIKGNKVMPLGSPPKEPSEDWVVLLKKTAGVQDCD